MINSYNDELFLFKLWTSIFFQFEIIINDLIIFFRFIWIPMLTLRLQINKAQTKKNKFGGGGSNYTFLSRNLL